MTDNDVASRLLGVAMVAVGAATITTAALNRYPLLRNSQASR